MLNLDFLEKGLGIVLPPLPHSVYDFSRKTDQFLLPDCLYFKILVNMCIAMVC